MSSVSQILRQTRESKGITLEEVAQRTYIKLPYLSALETGDVEQLPAPVYIHGYIRQYAKLLGLNGSELVLQYQQDASRPTAAKLALTPTHRPSPAVTEWAQTEHEAPRPHPLVESPLVPGVRERGLEPPAEGSASTPLRHEPSLREQVVPRTEISLREPNLISPAAPSAHEVQQAKQQAQHLLASAQREAHEMRVAAERYADQVLAQLESEINRSLQTVRNGRAYLQSRRRKLQEG